MEYRKIELKCSKMKKKKMLENLVKCAFKNCTKRTKNNNKVKKIYKRF